MTTYLPENSEFSQIDGIDLLRVMKKLKSRGLRAGKYFPLKITGKTPVDLLTLKFEKLKINKISEGLPEIFDDTAEIYCLTMITDGSGRPFQFRSITFENIKRGKFLPLGEGGMLLGCFRKPKWFIDIHIAVMESDSKIRNFGSILKRASEIVDLKTVSDIASGMKIFDPGTVANLVRIADYFFQTLIYLISENGDDNLAQIHDFYLMNQSFGKGRHPEAGLNSFGSVSAAYKIDLLPG